MKKELSTQNPYKKAINCKFNGAKAYLYELLHENKSENHLDFGAHDGELIMSLKKHDVISSGLGLDANNDVIQANSKHMLEDTKLELIKPNSSLQHNDNEFDSISIIGVIEHVVDQKKLINELYRVLKPGGFILVAAPGKHLFSFLDMGNWKFIFPTFHEWFTVLTKGRKFFEDKYSHNPNGLYGDVEVEKFWHEHFKKDDLKNLLMDCNLIIKDIDGFGFFNRILANTAFFTPKPIKKLFNKLIEIDALFFSSAEIWILAQKPDSQK